MHLLTDLYDIHFSYQETWLPMCLTNPTSQETTVRFGPWEGPLSVLLVPKLPSAHKSGTNYNVCIHYKPANQPSNLLGVNHPLRYPGAAGSLRAVCCGPSKDIGCPVGARVVGPCAHGVTALLVGFVLPQFPVIIIIWRNHRTYRFYSRMNSIRLTQTPMCTTLGMVAGLRPQGTSWLDWSPDVQAGGGVGYLLDFLMGDSVLQSPGTLFSLRPTVSPNKLSRSLSTLPPPDSSTFSPPTESGPVRGPPTWTSPPPSRPPLLASLQTHIFYYSINMIATIVLISS